MMWLDEFGYDLNKEIRKMKNVRFKGDKPGAVSYDRERFDWQGIWH
jgi:hypothetical protein